MFLFYIKLCAIVSAHKYLSKSFLSFMRNNILDIYTKKVDSYLSDISDNLQNKFHFYKLKNNK